MQNFKFGINKKLSLSLIKFNDNFENKLVFFFSIVLEQMNLILLNVYKVKFKKIS